MENLIKAPLVPRRLVVDQDIFQVLVEANMPAVLLELAFVTNPTEYKYLSSVAGQDEVAERLFKAFCSYKTKFDASVNVDTTAPKVEETPAKPAPATADKNVSSSDSEYYSIQIMGLGRYIKDGDPALKGLTVNRVKKEGSNIYKYVTGKYSAVSEAKSKLQEVRKKFPDAFVVKVTGDNVTRVN